MGTDTWRLIPETQDLVLRSPLKYFRDHFVGQPMELGWTPPAVDVSGTSRKPIPDFIPWMLSAPVITSKAKLALEPLLRGHVEFLPLTRLSDEDLWAMNVVTLADSLDESRSRIVYSPDDGRILNVLTFGFHEERLPDVPIFKLTAHPNDVFVRRAFVERTLGADLKGAVFVDPAANVFSLLLKGSSLETRAVPQAKSKRAGKS